MATADIRGASLEYSESGSGEPIILVHGSASDSRTWQHQLDEFGQHFRAISYSRRYHWPNQQIPEGRDYSMLEQLEDLEAFLTSLGAAPAHLVGSSYGAFLSLLLAIRRPSLVRTLVLGEPPVLPLFVSMPPKPLEILRVLVSSPRTAAAIVKFGATGIGPATKAVTRGDMETAMRVFGSAVLGRDFFGRLPASRVEQARVNFIGAELTGSGFAPLGAEQVRAVQVPALLLTGQHSPALFHRLTDRLEELLPQSERVDIRCASHVMHEDNVEGYNAAVLSFLASHRSVRIPPVSPST